MTETLERRFTCWLSEDERTQLNEMAKRENTSVNYLVRSAIRHFLRGDHLTDVTDVTRNKGDRAA